VRYRNILTYYLLTYLLAVTLASNSSKMAETMIAYDNDDAAAAAAVAAECRKYQW